MCHRKWKYAVRKVDACCGRRIGLLVPSKVNTFDMEGKCKRWKANVYRGRRMFAIEGEYIP